MLWCHNCQKQTNTPLSSLTCIQCGSGALQHPNSFINQPNNFTPYLIQPTDQQQLANDHSMLEDDFQQLDVPLMITFRTVLLESLERPGQFMIVRTVNSGFPFPMDSNISPVSNKTYDKLEKILDIKQCSICQQQGGKGIKLRCQHYFHQNCVQPWFTQTNTCPSCRTLVQ